MNIFSKEIWWPWTDSTVDESCGCSNSNKTSSNPVTEHCMSMRTGAKLLHPHQQHQQLLNHNATRLCGSISCAKIFRHGHYHHHHPSTLSARTSGIGGRSCIDKEPDWTTTTTSLDRSMSPSTSLRHQQMNMSRHTSRHLKSTCSQDGIGGGETSSKIKIEPNKSSL